MLLRRVKFKSNGSRNVIMQRNYMENLRLSSLVYRRNKSVNRSNRKLSYLLRSGLSPVPCKLSYIPKSNLLCGGIKTAGSLNRPMGVFYNSGSVIVNTLVKGLNFWGFSNNNGSIHIGKRGYGPGDYRYTHYMKYSTQVSSIFDSNYNITYRSSGGNYAIFMGCFKHTGFSVFRLPSGLKLRLPY